MAKLAHGAEARVVSVFLVFIDSMSNNGALQLPQAQSKPSVDPSLQNGKALSLPTQASGEKGHDAEDHKEEDVKIPPSVHAPVTEQMLSSMHGIVPTLQ